MEHDERIPGVTFRLTRGDKLPPIDPKKQKAMGEVALTAEINDFGVWEEVLERLNGMRIYTTDNLAEEMVNVAQEKTVKLRTAFEVEINLLKASLERRTQQLSFAEAERNEAQQTIIVQNQELERLRKIEKELQGLEAWAKDIEMG